MKTKQKKICSHCHDVIETQHVFSENNQVFLKNNCSNNTLTEEQWSPINFQWIPVVQLQERLTHI
ncbi:hypothetical protein Q4603_10185 [Zobellia galactanivorans]|uniref:hypothetical protein n=1 Tax=Zobellia galactanivorans (strain DSM 12802 / CCUG 47099 / CIP 106680 / NCIMB 13871 / Dsij) TaxID=63186 RepID=UPI0026E29A51|nr:hypothetical protein [Zobellia galactanivorans]MDO6808983.1 hypothetical protein [Zobellia galactanivorans]